jgi:uncharacterized membrane protein (UPF0127 family)
VENWFYMMTLNVQNLDRPLPAALQVRYCHTFWCRLRGLMFHPPLAADQGLLLAQTRENRRDAAIHMFFMRMDLAVVWLNSACKVVDIQLARRWRPAYTPKEPALYVMELSSLQISAFQVGDRLRFEDNAGEIYFEG